MQIYFSVVVLKRKVGTGKFKLDSTTTGRFATSFKNHFPVGFGSPYFNHIIIITQKLIYFKHYFPKDDFLTL